MNERQTGSCPLGLSGDLIGDSALLRMGQGEKLYKLYFFRPARGRGEYFEHRVLAKLRANGMLEMISYTVRVPSNGQPERSNVLRVPAVPTGTLERIVNHILVQTHAAPDEFEEVDLTGFDTLDEQLDHLRDRGLMDEMEG